LSIIYLFINVYASILYEILTFLPRKTKCYRINNAELAYTTADCYLYLMCFILLFIYVFINVYASVLIDTLKCQPRETKRF
jgi:hypothetical protein